ncbi:MAG TPA: hypothetical protein VGU23_01780 [Acidobacteriaceae bacterium]|nr:hypothetical protein [Acidobacteriaceae bacterium]
MPHQHREIALYPSEITNDEVARIVADQLHEWKMACDSSEGDIVIIEQEVFRRSMSDMHLLYTAIRYAGNVGKTVMIAPGKVLG